MLKALGDLSGKSTELQDALKLQFAKTKSLMGTTNVTVSGSIKLSPAGPAPEAPAPKPVAAPCAADAAIAPKVVAEVPKVAAKWIRQMNKWSHGS